MRIAVLGGGPAGLYFSIVAKLCRPDDDITVLERHRADDTYGWGVVFSDTALSSFAEADPDSHAEIVAALHRWDDIVIHYKGEAVRTTGHGFGGIARLKLLDILQRRARSLGVTLHFETDVGSPDDLPEVDLVVGADGIRSVVRNAEPERFQPEVVCGSTRFLWLGARCRLDAFTFDVRETEWGWITLHAYRFDADWSTFIVEMPESVWQRAGLDRMDMAASIAFCRHLFADRLGGAALVANAAHPRGSCWLRFERIACRHWHHDNRVLIGDAAHTLHFSIGSGTRQAMEDAIGLARQLAAHDDLPAALTAYQAEREVDVLRLRTAALNRQDWFENVGRYRGFEPWQFTYALLTGSQRLGHAELRRRDPAFVDRVESLLATDAGLPASPHPPLFLPFRLGRLTLPNRLVLSPMATYSAREGLPGDFHLVHLGARALGGAGLIMTEMTAVSAGARITPGCPGLWDEPQMVAWRRIVDFIHDQTPAKIGIQLGHAGPKGATRRGWEGMNEPLTAEGGEAAWPLIAPSAIPFDTGHAIPRAMTGDDMARVVADFAHAARRAATAGFDFLEIHAAHGYLLSAFLCPLTNHREDEWGGCLDNRLRFPLAVVRAVRDVWPAARPLGIRLSAHDWAPGGNTDDDAVAMARAFGKAGIDLVDVSSGLTTPDARPRYGRMYQTPFADRIRNEAGVATMAVGNIFDPDHVNTIIASGRADLCAIGRPLLADPAWPLRAAAQQGLADAPWPRPYLAARDQFSRAFDTVPQRPVSSPLLDGRKPSP